MDTYFYNPKFHRFADFLGVDKYNRDDPRLSKEIIYLYDWAARVAKSNEIKDILLSVNHLQKTVGTTLRGEELVKNLYQWARLDEKPVKLEAVVEDTTLVKRVRERQKEWDKNREQSKEVSKEAEDKNTKVVQVKQKEIVKEVKNTTDFRPAEISPITIKRDDIPLW